MKLCERYATRSNWRGYTYNDEMRSQALLQLSQIGLQFDESKSQNPFAYYTAAITNSFTRVLNIEKRNQNLRDDILQMNNLNPSYTRQMANSGSGGGFEE
jgi:ABC-type dipeptide/oligopeptide/nickel transport system ATPase subunit